MCGFYKKYLLILNLALTLTCITLNTTHKLINDRQALGNNELSYGF